MFGFVTSPKITAAPTAHQSVIEPATIQRVT